MTSDDIKEVQILAITKDGKYILTKSNEEHLIRYVVSYCQFIELRDDVFEVHSIKEFMKKGGEI